MLTLQLIRAVTLTGFENVDASGATASTDLAGSAGANGLAGGAAGEVINGRGGSDTLAGGAGNDVFVYANASDSGAAGGRDTILDFVGGQHKIDLRQLAPSAGLYWTGTTASTNGVWYERSGARL
jgi:Ca2+-binding RTX toxin-like protein